MTVKQRRWLKYYSEGKSPAEAAKQAGYNEATVERLFIIEEKSDAEKLEEKEIGRFWYRVMMDDEVSIQHRLKASELYMRLSDKEKNDPEGVVVVFSGEEGM